MRKWKAAVIGCGRIGAVYKSAFKKLADEVEVVLAVDKEEERAKAFAGDFAGCQWSEETDPAMFRQLLCRQKPDVVHILLPHHLHRNYGVAALESGCHVLTEKPVALTLDEADDMIAAARKSRRQLGVIFQNRYITGIREARRVLESGELGRITGAFSNLNWHRPPSYYTCDWKGFWATEGGGVVIDQAIHSIDLVRYLLRKKVKTVDGHYSCRVLKRLAPQVEVEDEADAAITFEEGVVYSFFATNYYTDNRPIQVEISCERGSIHLEHQTVTICREGGEPQVISQRGEQSGESYWGVCHYDQIRDFYQCLEEGRPVPWSPEDAKETLEVVLAIYQSSRLGQLVELPLKQQ